MSRVVCRRGVPSGALSAVFTAEDLLAALLEDDVEYVYAEPDGAGGLAPAGVLAHSGALGAARLCVRARLAPSPPARTATVELAGGALRLRTAAPLAPHAELLLWVCGELARALAVPHLTPRDVCAAHYVCRRCAAAFPDPNPLKLHLFLRCRPAPPPAFWREAAARLCSAPASPPPPPPPDPARFEALAAEWGRARAGVGHLCVFCGKLYSRRYGLKIHLRTHTGYRPLRCRHCLRAFGDPSNLNKHVRLHLRRCEGPRPALAPAHGFK